MLVIFHSSLSSRKYLCSISSCKEVGKGQGRHREDSTLNSSLSPSLCPDTIFSPDFLSHSDLLTSCLHSLPYFHISDSLLKPSQPACNPHYSAKNTLSQVTSIEVTVWRRIFSAARTDISAGGSTAGLHPETSPSLGFCETKLIFLLLF